MHFSTIRIGYVDIAGRSPVKGVKQLQGWEMRRTHSPGGATTAEFFDGVIFCVSITKKTSITTVINVILFSLKLTKQYHM